MREEGGLCRTAEARGWGSIGKLVNGPAHRSRIAFDSFMENETCDQARAQLSKGSHRMTGIRT